jgi:hypothetical protein
MKCLLNSSTMPVCCSMASSPIGLPVRGGPNRAFTNCMNCGHVEAAAIEFHAMEPQLGIVQKVE